MKIHPKRLFLIDGLGATLSVVLLGIVLPSLHHFHGMPISVLHWLAGLAVIFALFSFTNHFRFSNAWRRNLRIIAFGNFFYCALTLVLIIANWTQIRIFGVIYFAGEILIIGGLAGFELKVAGTFPTEAEGK